MPGRARSGRGAWARWRAWLGRANDLAPDEPEERAPLVAPNDEAQSLSPTSLDAVLRDAAQRREAGDDRTAGSGAPTGS